MVEVKTVVKPLPADDEILVQVLMSAVTIADARIRGARFPRGFALLARLALGVTSPRRKILGGSFSGVVESVGAKVTDFRAGDEVCGMTGARMGAHAEFLTIKAGDAVVRKPGGVSHADAAAVVFGGTTALYFLRDRAAVAEGMSVLVNGASGAVGTNCVQLAKVFGATVTGVTSTANVELVSSLGADRVVDYEREDLTGAPDRYDLVIDTVGNLTTRESEAMLTPSGRVALVVTDLAQTISRRKRVVQGLAPERKDDIGLLVALVERGDLRPVVDSTYDLEDVVAAHRRVDTGHKVGNVLLRTATSSAGADSAGSSS